MLKNYLKITLRNLLKFRAYLLVNILGLSVGIACALLATVFILDESTFDQFHSDHEQIYRIIRSSTAENGTVDWRCDVSGLMGPTAAADMPEVADAIRVLPWFGEDVLSFEQTHLKLHDQLFVDANFFEHFDFKLLQGNPETVLRDPGSIVLSTSVAEGLFGRQEPIGKTVLGVNGASFTVTGIVEDAPRNSHLQYNSLMSWSSTVPGTGQLSFNFTNNWLGQTVYTYLKLNEGTDTQLVSNKLHGLIKEHLPKRGSDYHYDLQAVADVYLGSDFINGNRRVRLGSAQFLNILGAIALFVLVIACLNYINITTSKATKRAQEIGVRKVLGANRSNLFAQFMGDSFILTLLSALIAVLLVDLFIPFFNELTGRYVTSNILLNGKVLLSLAALVVLVSFASGAYPATLLSALRPAATVKGEKHSKKGAWARQSMIVFQFLLSTLMIIGAMVVYQQHQYLISKDLGFDKENVIVSNIGGNLPANYQAIQTELERHPDILNTAVCQAAMVTGTFGSTVIPEGSNDELDVAIFRVDVDFIDIWGLKMVEGRKFDANLSQAQSGVIVNQTFLDQMGWNEGTTHSLKFSASGSPVNIIGVVNDFNYGVLTDYTLGPVLMYLDNRKSNLTVKTTGNNTEEVLAHMKATWETFESRLPFDYFFMEDYLENQYLTQSRFFKLITIFSAISIIIACLGLYGLTAFMIEQKTKEIGIRKVLGATVSHILLLINRQFVILILMALVLATPLGYYFAEQWLADFPYRITLGVLAFAVAALSIFSIAIFTTSHQAYRASKMDPVNSLRYE